MKFSSFLADIRLVCPGMPEPWQYRFLSRSLQTFLAETQVWQEWTDHAWDFTAASGGVYAIPNSKYNPTGPVDSVPTVRTDRILDIKWLPTGDSLYKTTRSEADRRYLDWRTARGKEPKVWFPLNSGYASGGGYTVRLVPYPEVTDPVGGDDTAGALSFLVSHTVTELETPEQVYDFETVSATSGIADWIFRRYRETIVAGALARALITPGVDWNNDRLAVAYAQSFSLGMDRARSETQAGQTTSHVVVAYGGY